MNQGKIGVREIGQKKLELDFSENDSWVREALEKSAPHSDITGQSAEQWAQDAKCNGHIQIERLDPEYNLEGNFEARVKVLCPHCGNPGTVGRADSFRLFIKQVGPRDEFEEGDDPDYIFLETPWIDLSSILSEQIVSAEPVVEYPDQDPQGNPHKCEGLLNNSELSTGQNEVKAGSSPFAALAKLKAEVDKKAPKKR
jgi:uncharacterized metal-binding protein YceD (DUF177 family)